MVDRFQDYQDYVCTKSFYSINFTVFPDSIFLIGHMKCLKVHWNTLTFNVGQIRGAKKEGQRAIVIQSGSVIVANVKTLPFLLTAIIPALINWNSSALFLLGERYYVLDFLSSLRLFSPQIYCTCKAQIHFEKSTEQGQKDIVLE